MTFFTIESKITSYSYSPTSFFDHNIFLDFSWHVVDHVLGDADLFMGLEGALVNEPFVTSWANMWASLHVYAGHMAPWNLTTFGSVDNCTVQYASGVGGSPSYVQ